MFLRIFLGKSWCVNSISECFRSVFGPLWMIDVRCCLEYAQLLIRTIELIYFWPKAKNKIMSLIFYWAVVRCFMIFQSTCGALKRPKITLKNTRRRRRRRRYFFWILGSISIHFLGKSPWFWSQMILRRERRTWRKRRKIKRKLRLTVAWTIQMIIEVILFSNSLPGKLS